MLSFSAGEKKQLASSIEKLFHYLLSGLKKETHVIVTSSGTIIYEKLYKPPTAIFISPSLYTRLDACHGAGNCCRVPFDLVYTKFDRQRIVEYDVGKVAAIFGKESADRFTENRSLLLSRLVEVDVWFAETGVDHTVQSKLYIQQNRELNKLSGTASCPYLFIGGDRYFCGVHPFKPLHCWWPHMVMRINKDDNPAIGPSVHLGRMQYGRNHNFGCPVLFEESSSVVDSDSLFDEGSAGPTYFDLQYEDDIAKLEWTSRSAESLGFNNSSNFIVGVHSALRNASGKIRECLKTGNYVPIQLR